MQHKIHDQHDAILMSLSAIAMMADHPYNYWKDCQGIKKAGVEHTEMATERCEKIMQRTCELLDEVMQYLGDCNNAVDAVDEHGMTDSAFKAMDRAIGRGTTR